MQRLKYIPATIEAKTRAIHSKVYGAAMYGVEAGQVAPTMIAKMTAAVIDVFRSRNNNHNVDQFFATITNDANELDPLAQLLTRRTMQMRRTANKKIGMVEKYGKTIQKYAGEH